MRSIRRLFSGLTERSIYLAALVFVLGYCLSIATKLSTLAMTMVLIPWGLTLAYRGCREYMPLRQPHFRFAAVGAVIYLIACAISRDAVADWRDYVYLVFIFTFGLLMMPRKATLANMHAELFWVGAMFVLVYLPFQLIALTSLYSGNVIKLPYIPYRIGLQAKNLFTSRIRVLFNPNVDARYSSCCIIFCLYALFSRKSRLIKVVSAFCILVNTIIIVHTQCRTCYIGLAVVAAAIAFRGIYLLLIRNRLKIPAGALAAVIAFFLILSLLDTIYVTDLRIAQSFSVQLESESTVSSTASETAVVTRSESEGMFNVTSTSRTVLWDAVLNYLFDHPRYILTGMGPMPLIAQIGESYPHILSFAPLDAHLHNSFLSALAHGSVFYLLSVLAFLVTLVRPCWLMLLAPTNEENRGLFIAPIAILMLLVFSVAEASLFLSASITNVFFYSFAGWIFHWNELQKTAALKD